MKKMVNTNLDNYTQWLGENKLGPFEYFNLFEDKGILGARIDSLEFFQFAGHFPKL